MPANVDLEPQSEAALCETIAEAAARDVRLAIRGGGSKGGVGRPTPDALTLAMRGFTGVVDYDPQELVLTVRPGTPLAEVQAIVAAEGQMLAFDPFDHGPIFGRRADAATIGGVVAAGVAGSQRLAYGGARDHLLGFRAVSGRGELFVAGAKVVKNVTGYDLPKLIAGSWGRLAAITEVTLKVLPAPRVRTTLVLAGLEPLRAAAAMAEAMGSQAEPAAAAHLPRAAGPLTAFRIQGFHASVAARARGLAERLETYGAVRQAEAEEAEDLWRNLGTLSSLPADWPLWRVNVPPSAGAALTSALESHGAQWLLDWAGGLAWIAFDGDPEMVRAQARLAGGHAMLVRGGEMRAQVSAFHPPEPGVARLEARIRRAFDPQGVFETGRF